MAAIYTEYYLAKREVSPEDKDAPLFRNASKGRAKWLTNNPMITLNIWYMLKRRLKAAGLPTKDDASFVSVLAWRRIYWIKASRSKRFSIFLDMLIRAPPKSTITGRRLLRGILWSGFQLALNLRI